MAEQKYGLIKRILSLDFRSDGRLVRKLTGAQKLMPYFMKSRNSSAIHFKHSFDITHALQYIKKRNEDPAKERVTLFILLLAALVRTGVLHPKLNCFVAGKRIYARNKLQVSYLLKQQMSENGQDHIIKQTFSPQDTLEDVAKKVNAAINKGRKGNDAEGDSLIKTLLKLPGFILSIIFFLENVLNNIGLLPAVLINADPLFSSVFVANLGSLGLDAPYHHLYERGTISLFVVLGKYQVREIYGKDNKPFLKSTVDMSFTIDERIAGGYSIAQAFKSLIKFMENPALLEEPPEKYVEDD